MRWSSVCTAKSVSLGFLHRRCGFVASFAKRHDCEPVNCGGNLLGHARTIPVDRMTERTRRWRDNRSGFEIRLVCEALKEPTCGNRSLWGLTLARVLLSEASFRSAVGALSSLLWSHYLHPRLIETCPSGFSWSYTNSNVQRSSQLRATARKFPSAARGPCCDLRGKKKYILGRNFGLFHDRVDN